MRVLTHTYYLTLRALRESIRQPAFEVQNIFIPLFFFAVTVGAIGNIAGRAFGVDNFTGFQMPVAILQGVAGTASWGGLATTTDIERGYFDKLLLTPSPRIALILGRLFADSVRAMAVTTLIVVIGLIAGTGMEAGAIGAVTIVIIGGLFGLAYAGIGLAIALRTGSPQAAQAGFLLFFPLLFLSPAFAPKEIFSGWLEFLATINPVTYILGGMRHLVLEGWSWSQIGGALACIAGMGALTLSLTLVALRWRTA
ncbi:MAG: ABC transporter permease [Dehalococcoidia bacterium]|nr:ABC transporter permease [Dehalococcoidia bacterium]